MLSWSFADYVETPIDTRILTWCILFEIKEVCRGSCTSNCRIRATAGILKEGEGAFSPYEKSKQYSMPHADFQERGKLLILYNYDVL